MVHIKLPGQQSCSLIPRTRRRISISSIKKQVGKDAEIYRIEQAWFRVDYGKYDLVQDTNYFDINLEEAKKYNYIHNMHSKYIYIEIPLGISY